MAAPKISLKAHVPWVPESFQVGGSGCPTACHEDLGADGASKGCSYLMSQSRVFFAQFHPKKGSLLPHSQKKVHPLPSLLSLQKKKSSSPPEKRFLLLQKKRVPQKTVPPSHPQKKVFPSKKKVLTHAVLPAVHVRFKHPRSIRAAIAAADLPPRFLLTCL